MKSLLDLKVQEDEQVSAAKWNALLEHLRASQIVSGAQVRVSRTPSGTLVTARPQAVPIGGAFQVRLGADEAGTGQAAEIGRGLIEGIEPEIGGKKIGGDPAKPDIPPPKLPLPKPSKPEGYLYLKIQLKKENWRIEKAEPVFQEKPPAPGEWVAWKLLAILRRNGDQWQLAHQAVHFNLGHFPAARKSNGKARHLFFAR
jgi:hypothetical protein